MKNKFSISTYIYFVYGFLFLILLLVIIPKITVSLKDDSNSIAYRNIEIIDKDVYLINNFNEKLAITLPHTAKDVQRKKEFDIFVDLNKFEDLTNKSIGIQVKYADLTISADGKIFFELNTPKNYIPKSGGGYGYYIVDLPKDMKSKLIVIHITPNLNMKFDKILLDVPCSGLGVLRKKPEKIYDLTSEKIKELKKLQKKIFDSAYGSLKENGVILYSTCTFSINENTNNLKYFLEKYSDLSVEEIIIPENIDTQKDEFGGIYMTHKNVYNDGFYIAKLRKMSNNLQ